MASRLPYMIAALFVIALDQATKAVVAARLAHEGAVSVIPGLFDLTFVKNPGGVFGMFKNLDSSLRAPLFTVVPVIAIGLIVLFAARLPVSHRFAQTALSLILGGAVGNLIDRFSLGYVIDFFDVYWRGHHWPAFNVADSAICIGVGMLMLETFLAPDRAAKRGDARAEIDPASGETP
jgi:signal peptidase II